MNKCEKREKVIRVFPRRTKWTPDDNLVFIGSPGLFRPVDRNIPVKISVTFTWDIEEGEHLLRSWSRFYDNVKLGGPAFGDPGGEFTPGLFIKPGVTITSRGCNKKCPWCYIPLREKHIREITIKDGWIVQDNNLLACSAQHLKKVFKMLSTQTTAGQFKGGLDITLLKKEHLKLFNSIRISELWFSYDSEGVVHMLSRAADLFQNYPRDKKYCYVLIGFNGETLLSAESRLKTVYRLGFLPFAQLYRGNDIPHYTRDFLKLQRNWSRPAIYKTIMKEGKEGEYNKLVPESLNRGSTIQNPKSEIQSRPPQAVPAGVSKVV